jgi:hypothetical protein
VSLTAAEDLHWKGGGRGWSTGTWHSHRNSPFGFKVQKDRLIQLPRAETRRCGCGVCVVPSAAQPFVSLGGSPLLSHLLHVFG